MVRTKRCRRCGAVLVGRLGVACQVEISARQYNRILADSVVRAFRRSGDGALGALPGLRSPQGDFGNPGVEKSALSSTPQTTFVTGRPREHRSPAARQAAYRKRQKGVAA